VTGIWTSAARSGIQERWTIARGQNGWSIQGVYTDQGKEVGKFYGTDSRYENGRLLFLQKFDPRPPGWPDVVVKIEAWVERAVLLVNYSSTAGSGQVKLTRDR
jgi:hypothetical protein